MKMARIGRQGRRGQKKRKKKKRQGMAWQASAGMEEQATLGRWSCNINSKNNMSGKWEWRKELETCGNGMGMSHHLADEEDRADRYEEASLSQASLMKGEEYDNLIMIMRTNSNANDSVASEQ